MLSQLPDQLKPIGYTKTTVVCDCKIKRLQKNGLNLFKERLVVAVKFLLEKRRVYFRFEHPYILKPPLWEMLNLLYI